MNPDRITWRDLAVFVVLFAGVTLMIAASACLGDRMLFTPWGGKFK